MLTGQGVTVRYSLVHKETTAVHLLPVLELLDPEADFFTFVAGLSRFMAAFRLSRKTEEKVFFG